MHKITCRINKDKAIGFGLYRIEYMKSLKDIPGDMISFDVDIDINKINTIINLNEFSEIKIENKDTFYGNKGRL
jgi:hypothetical protein